MYCKSQFEEILEEDKEMGNGRENEKPGRFTI